MPKKAMIIVGLGYGDEGKGLATDFYCQQSDSPLVIRFNGGHQAGHTVVKTDGRRHVFSSFGAGTLSGAPTYWSSYCTISLAALLREYEELARFSNPKLLLDPQCPVTTHYDVLFNRAIEATRGKKRHGSCGLGFGATIERHKRLGVKLTVQDLLSQSILQSKLMSVRQYYHDRINCETKFLFEQFDHDKEDVRFEQDVTRFSLLHDQKAVDLIDSESVFGADSPWNTFVFEGAQGILLDMDFGQYPHVTHSNTTSKNALQLLHQYAPALAANATVIYVTRCYQTRHGAGQFQACRSKKYFANDLETNVYNAYQGEFKTGLLDIDAINYALNCDAKFSRELSKHILITCLDQLPSNIIPFRCNGAMKEVLFNELPSLLSSDFDKVKFSFSNNSDLLR